MLVDPHWASEMRKSAKISSLVAWGWAAIARSSNGWSRAASGSTGSERKEVSSDGTELPMLVWDGSRAVVGVERMREKETDGFDFASHLSVSTSYILFGFCLGYLVLDTAFLEVGLRIVSETVFVRCAPVPVAVLIAVAV